MIAATFRPLAKPIPRPAKGYQSCPFSASWRHTLDTLERELGYLKATDIIIEIDLQSGDIRNDGWPRSSARPASPGIRLSFGSKHGPLSYTCATYDGWEANVRAVSLTLERLRAVDRYGAVKGGEQYKGWKQLPPGGERAPIQASEWATVEAARRWLGEMCVLPSGEPLDRLYRECAKIAHPDRGGSEDMMSRVNRARDFIEQHAGEAA